MSAAARTPSGTGGARSSKAMTPTLMVTPRASAVSASARTVSTRLRATAAAPARVDARQQDRELVAAEAGDDVGRAQPLAQHARDARQQAVAGRVAERVVDGLEAVEVEHERGALGAVAAHVREVPRELLLEAAAVREPGERVVVGEVAQLGGRREQRAQVALRARAAPPQREEREQARRQGDQQGDVHRAHARMIDRRAADLTRCTASFKPCGGLY